MTPAKQKRPPRSRPPVVVTRRDRVVAAWWLEKAADTHSVTLTFSDGEMMRYQPTEARARAFRAIASEIEQPPCESRRVEELERAVRWALGYPVPGVPEFRQRAVSEGAFWWRTQLQDMARLSPEHPRKERRSRGR